MNIISITAGAAGVRIVRPHEVRVMLASLDELLAQEGPFDQEQVALIKQFLSFLGPIRSFELRLRSCIKPVETRDQWQSK